MRLWPALIIALICAPAKAQDIRLEASPALIESGVLKHLLPRFSLKTQVRVKLAPLKSEGVLAEGIDLMLSQSPDGGQAVMQGAGQTWYLTIAQPPGPKSKRFVDWLRSDIGGRTIAAYKRDGVQLFEPLEAAPVVEVTKTLSGDIALGRKLSFQHCARCHVIGPENRMKGLGSTPSFALMRTFDDWQNRYGAFYSLNPHPSFTQVKGVTDPFDPARPPPIHPLQITLTQLEDILAFVATIKPADLGQTLKHQ